MKEYIKKESKRIPFQGELKPCHKLFSAWSSQKDKQVKKHDFKRNLSHMILISNQMVILLKLRNNFTISLVNIRSDLLIVLLNMRNFCNLIGLEQCYFSLI